MKPIGPRVLVSLTAVKTESPGGIILPGGEKSNIVHGQVISVDPDVQLVKVGDLVYFTEYAGTEIAKGILVVDVENILAVE